jgi:uncharacterized protein YggE
MRRNVTWAFVGLALGVTIALTLPSIAQTPSPAPEGRTVAVTGTATIRSDPDQATVTLGVQTTAQTAEAAMRDNANEMTDVIAAIRHQGVAADDIATAWINLYPRYDDSGTAVTGYTAENQVNVTVRDMDAIGAVIDAAVQAGANLSSGISFGLSDTNRGLDDALQEAVADARSKAEVLAEAGGAQLGAVVQITEGSSPTPVYFRDYAVAAAEASPTPVETPTIETQVVVSVTWQLI